VRIAATTGTIHHPTTQVRVAIATLVRRNQIGRVIAPPG
jgi:hypothetical protein